MYEILHTSYFTRVLFFQNSIVLHQSREFKLENSDFYLSKKLKRDCLKAARCTSYDFSRILIPRV